MSSPMNLQSQIADLVSKMNPQTKDACYQDLDKLIKNYGFEAYKFLVAALIEAIDLHAPNLSQHDNLAPQQLANQTRTALLAHVFKILKDKPNFHTAMAEVLNNYSTKMGDVLRLLARKFNLHPDLIIGISVASLNIPNYQAPEQSVDIIREEILEKSPPALSENVVRSLYYAVNSVKLFDQYKDSIIQRLQSIQIQSQEMNQSNSPYQVQQQQQQQQLQMIQNEMRLGMLFKEIGYTATSTEDAVRDMLKLYQKDLGNQQISNQTIACLIGELVSSHTGLPSRPDALQTLMQQFGESYEKYKNVQDPGTWKMENLAAVLKEHSYIDWNQVIEKLDYPNFQLVDKKSLALLVLIHQKATNDSPFPIDKAISRIWKNANAQLQFCVLGLSFPPSSLNYSSENLHGVSVGEKLQQSTQPVQHAAWSNIEFIQILLNLATENRVQPVAQLFEKAVEQSPERIFVGIAQSQCPNRRFQVELISRHFLPIFIPKTQGKQSSKTSIAALDRFCFINPGVFSDALSTYFLQDMKTIDSIVDALQEMKALEVVMATSNPILSTQIAITSSLKQNNILNFSLWLKTVLALNGEKYLPVFIQYLKSTLPNLDLANSEQKGLIEYVALFFKWIPALTGLKAEPLSQEIMKSASVPKQIWEEIAKLQKKAVFSVPNNIEQSAENNLKEIFKGNITIDDAWQLLKNLKQSNKDSDRKEYACMIHTLFDEYRFFQNHYSQKKLKDAALLFGEIINHDIIKGKSLELAKYLIIVALKTGDNRMLYFALFSLDRCCDRLSEWPHFCSVLKHLVPHDVARSNFPKLIQQIQEATSVSSSDKKKVPIRKQAESQPQESISIYAKPKDSETLVLHGGETITFPPDEIRSNIVFTFNNLSQGTNDQEFEGKVKNLKDSSGPDYYPYLAYYIVVERSTSEVGQQDTYIKLMEAFNDKDFEKQIMRRTYRTIKTLLETPLKQENTKERSTLHNLGIWLGRVTLARNKPILVKRLDLQKLLLDSFQNGKLAAVTSFTRGVMVQIANSAAFKPPNPWTMMILSLMKEIHDHPEIGHSSIKFDFILTTKHLGIKAEDVPARERPFLANLNIAKQEFTGPSASGEGEFDISKLPEANIQSSDFDNIVIDMSLDIFQQYPPLKMCVLHALNEAIREVNPPVVKRCVTIACRTACELVTKDHIFDPDVSHFRRSSIFIASGLASRLARVTCKDPLETSLQNHLRSFLKAAVVKESEALFEKIEVACKSVAVTNLEFARAHIENAAKEAARVTILENLAPEIEQRSQYFASGGTVPWTMTQHSPTLRQLPDTLTSNPNVQNQAQNVYDSFANLASLSNAGHENYFAQANMRKSQAQPASAAQAQSGSAAQGLQQARISFDEASKLINHYLTNIVGHSQKLKTDSRLASLRPDSEIIMHVVLIPKLLRQCEDVHRISTFVADNMLRLSYNSKREDSIFIKDVYVYFLRASTKVTPEIVQEISIWWSKLEDQNQKYSDISLRFLMESILDSGVVDEDLSRAVHGKNSLAIAFAVQTIRECIQTTQRFKSENFADTLTQLSMISNQLPPQQASMITDLYEKSMKGKSSVIGYDSDIHHKDQIISSFHMWMKDFTDNAPLSKMETFVTDQLQKSRLLTTNNDFVNLCKILTKYSVNHFYTELESARNSNTVDQVASQFQLIDGYSKLIVRILLMSNDESKLDLLEKALEVTMKTVIRDHEMYPERFNQRPYQRIFSNLMIMISQTHQPETYSKLLPSFASTLFMLRPQSFPGFAFSWVDLISHRMLMPKLLENGPKSREDFFGLMRALFKFLKPHLEKRKLSDPIKYLYKATLRILLVLLHDFSEFLCEYHFSLCDEIAPICVQMRNLILSAFPRHMQPPDPFTPNLKVDRLPEIKQSPKILSNFTASLEKSNLKAQIDHFLDSRNNNQTQVLNNLIPALLLPTQEALEVGHRYNVSLINSLVLYIGVKAVESPNSHTESQEMDIFKKLTYELDSEGRYHLFNAIVNQLRYPNSHTYHFSRVILYLFAYVKLKDDEELIQEQITRVILERLIANRPHPWGLFVTFIELIRNQRYGILEKDFTRCAPEITSIFNNARPAVSDSGQIYSND